MKLNSIFGHFTFFLPKILEGVFDLKDVYILVVSPLFSEDRRGA